MVRLGVVVATAFAVLACAVPASAVVVTRYAGLAVGSMPDGIAAGSDGSVFVSEESVDKITKMATTGLFQPGGSGGDRPTSLVTGPSVAGPRGSGSIWASLTNAKAVLRIDSLTGASETISTTGVSDCGPRGIAVGPTAGFIYFTLPNPGDGSCTSPSMIGWVPTATFSPVSGTPGFGAALDLDSAAGKLFVPDPDANVIRRAALDPTTGAPTIDGTFPIPGGGSPRGITTSCERNRLDHSLDGRRHRPGRGRCGRRHAGRDRPPRRGLRPALRHRDGGRRGGVRRLVRQRPDRPVRPGRQRHRVRSRQRLLAVAAGRLTRR